MSTDTPPMGAEDRVAHKPGYHPRFGCTCGWRASLGMSHPEQIGDWGRHLTESLLAALAAATSDPPSWRFSSNMSTWPQWAQDEWHQHHDELAAATLRADELASSLVAAESLADELTVENERLTEKLAAETLRADAAERELVRLGWSSPSVPPNSDLEDKRTFDETMTGWDG